MQTINCCKCHCKKESPGRSGLSDSSRNKLSCELFQEYCQNTSIHGVKYIGEPKMRLLDRWWWIISFVVSIVMCFYLIRNLWIKWQDTPVIVSFSEYPTSVWEIPFPAGNSVNNNKYSSPKLTSSLSLELLFALRRKLKRQSSITRMPTCGSLYLTTMARSIISRLQSK